MTKSSMQKFYTVMVVDDDEKYRRSVERLLSLIRLADRDTQFKVLAAESGAVAMSMLSHHSVDCVLLDYKMPGGDGATWLKRMLKEQSDLAIIMVTGAGSESLAAQTMREGAMDYIVKGSMDVANLERAILNALAKVEMRRTIEAQRRELVEAEKHRAMVVSLGAACHHMGQPATVISTYLDMMKRRETDPDMVAMIDECAQAADSLSEVLQRLRSVSHFRTEPYLPLGIGEAHRDDEEILKI